MPNYTQEYVSVPIENIQLVQVKRWKLWKPGIVEVSINFIGTGLYDSGWESYIKQFLTNRGIEADKALAFVEGTDIYFLDKELKAGSRKSFTGGEDRLFFILSFKDGDVELQELLNDLAPFLSGYTQSGGEYLFYDVVNYVRK